MGFITADYPTELIRRYDDDGLIPYFSAADFVGLNAEPISFRTERGITLRGFVYAYPEKEPADLVVLSHGIGGGHLAYMREIELLCRNGHRVLAFDAAGCFASEGESIYSLAEGIAGVRACLEFVQTQDKFRNVPVSLFGHSWGAYAVANVLRFFNNISAAVISGGFLSVQSAVELSIPAGDEATRHMVLSYEKAASPEYWNLSAGDALAQTNARVLVIHSKDDLVIPAEHAIVSLKDKIDRPNLHFRLEYNKAHNPHYTEEAVEYLNSFFFEYQKGIASGKLDTFEKKKAYMEKADIVKMTQQDTDVWAEILDILKV